MIHGSRYDLNSPLVCEGIVGDGCGGGRLFVVDDEKLIAYDPQTKESNTLLENVSNAEKISKKVCIVTVECGSRVIEFDLSLMKEI